MGRPHPKGVWRGKETRRKGKDEERMMEKEQRRTEISHSFDGIFRNNL
jgi:hypothetical protein